MIRQLAQCPYCHNCEVALTDSPEVVFNPDKNPAQPCPHLVWIEGRYSQWELAPLPGRKTRIPRMIGSTEFAWQHPLLGNEEEAGRLQTFLKELVGAGVHWGFAPAEVHLIFPISRDQSITDSNGKSHPSWEIEGAAVFAEDAAAFVASLPACLASQSAAWEAPPSFPR